MIKLYLGITIGASAGLFGTQNRQSSVLTAVAVIGLLIGLALIFSWAKELEHGIKKEEQS